MFVLKQLRRKKRISQTDLANVIGVSLRTIQLYEKKNANIPIKNLTKIAKYFEVTIAELYSNEVNEEEGIYSTSKGNKKEGVAVKTIAVNKHIISAPLVTYDNYGEFIEKGHLKDFIVKLPKVGFVLEHLEKNDYMAFEIMGNAMFDKTIKSIPNKTITLGYNISIDNNEELMSIVNRSVILVLENTILCKQILKIDKNEKKFICHSLNTSPEYSDFELPLHEVKSLFKIVKKQTD